MKEIILRLANDIADYITRDARELGLTSEELTKYIVGTYVQCRKRENKLSSPKVVVGVDIEELIERVKGDMFKFGKEFLKKKAQSGELTCKNCTMKLTEQDIEDEKCSTCGAPMKEALGGGT